MRPLVNQVVKCQPVNAFLLKALTEEQLHKLVYLSSNLIYVPATESTPKLVIDLLHLRIKIIPTQVVVGVQLTGRGIRNVGGGI